MFSFGCKLGSVLSEAGFKWFQPTKVWYSFGGGLSGAEA